jgi:hypothetical protein
LHNEVIASLTAGFFAAAFTNGIETIAVNKQANPKLGIKDIFSDGDSKSSETTKGWL